MESDQTANQKGRVDPNLWVEAYGDYLYRYAYSRLRDANAAEEVVQETFMNGIRYHAQFSGKGAEQAWLLGILKRKIIDYVRKRAKENKVTPYEDDLDPTNQLFDAKGNWRDGAVPWSTAPDSQLQSKELMALVMDCMTTLPQGQSDVFMLSVMQGMESEEICQELAITPQNLWVRMHRARLGLAKCVGSKWFAEGEVSSHAE
jgi:RNA polymerase sigma-70 factor (ECF subfamily)